MPNPGPVIPPGSAGNDPNKFPQWGFNKTGQIVEAKNSAQKVADIDKGYADWFTSRAEAESAFKGMQGFFGSGGLDITNPLTDALKYLAGAATWLSDRQNIFRVIKVGVGVGLIFMGISQLRVVAKGESIVVNSVGKASKVAATAAIV